MYGVHIRKQNKNGENQKYISRNLMENNIVDGYFFELIFLMECMFDWSSTFMRELRVRMVSFRFSLSLSLTLFLSYALRFCTFFFYFSLSHLFAFRFRNRILTHNTNANLLRD